MSKRLSVFAAAALTIVSSGARAAVTDLLISEVVEGNSANYKYIEIINRGATPVQLDDPSNQVQIRRFTNGATAPSATIMNLSGTIAAGGRFVAANNVTDFQNVHGVSANANVYNSYIQHNGDDSYDLYNAGTSSVIDGFAKDWVTGSDPGNPAPDGVVFRVLSALPNNGNFGQTTVPASGTTTTNGYWHYVAFTTGNGGASTNATPGAGGGGGVEVPVSLSCFQAE